MKLVVKWYNKSGGMLDECQIEFADEDTALLQAKSALRQILKTAILSPGDQFVIEEK
jgi:hypothetical protein